MALSPERRQFLRASCGAALAVALPQPALAASRSRPVLVCVNLTGGLDGLSVVVPHGEDAYYRARPSICVPSPGKSGGALPLVDGFGLHPALEPLYQLYQEGLLALVPAAGGAHFGRSHFAARDAMHFAAAPNGGAATGRTRDGWANRYAQIRSEATTDPCLLSTTAHLPLAMSGEAPTEMILDYRAFSGDEDDAAHVSALMRLYDGASDPFAESASRALRFAADVRDRTRQVRLRESYSDAGRGMRDAARLIVADVGADIVWVEIGGFDTHRSQGGAEGQLAGKLARLGRDLAAFRKDLGKRFSDVVLVTLTEFGRTLAETGARGTDHGGASTMLVLGGQVQGGRLVGRWPGLDGPALSDGRELAVTTDYRAVLADVLTSHLGLDAGGVGRVFPGFDSAKQEPLRLFAPSAG